MRLVAITLVIGAFIVGCGSGSSAGQGDKDKAVAAAHVAFQQAQKSGRDLGAGPCIAERLPGLSDWAADVAHDPRQPVDDQPGNQCSSFRAGQTHHFVELTPDGQLIRAQ